MQEGETQIGNDILNIEAVRFQLKTQFDRNIVTQFEVQEQILDYTFSHLNIDTSGCVNHPIFMTEALLSPNHSRSCTLNLKSVRSLYSRTLVSYFFFVLTVMSELLFEGYRVPGICYGIDSLLSYSNNVKNLDCALIISVGYHCTHIIPFVDGHIDPSRCKRIDIGGYHITYYLHKLLQLKYPAHLNAITLSRAEVSALI